ncbi:MAG: hypothetical protein ACI33M_10100 [Lysinibacillus sp.]
MEIEISGAGIGFGLFCVGVGIASMGYYIGKGLKKFRQPEKEINKVLVRLIEVHLLRKAPTY